MGTPKSELLWAEAIRKVVSEHRKNPDGSTKTIRTLNLLAKTIVASALKGDMAALKEVGDRLDGKPKQSVESTSKSTVEYVVRVPEKEETTEAWFQKYAPKTGKPTVQ